MLYDRTGTGTNLSAAERAIQAGAGATTAEDCYYFLDLNFDETIRERLPGHSAIPQLVQVPRSATCGVRQRHIGCVGVVVT